MWVLISSRSISLIFVKLGEQFSIQAGFYLACEQALLFGGAKPNRRACSQARFYLMSIFIVSLSHVTLLRLVVVKMCH